MKKLFHHAFLLYFCAMTAYAFWFTVTKIQIPGIPWPLLRYHYGMMAPYQGYPRVNSDLLAEGRRRSWELGAVSEKQEEWAAIDLDHYYPMILGNRIMYRRLRSFHAVGEHVHREKYTELARLIREKEAVRGKDYDAVRLTWQEWPMSQDGFEALRDRDHLKEYFITQFP